MKIKTCCGVKPRGFVSSHREEFYINDKALIGLVCPRCKLTHSIYTTFDALVSPIIDTYKENIITGFNEKVEQMEKSIKIDCGWADSYETEEE